MNKNKLIVLLVLLIAVVGLTMGSVSAKIIKVDVKNKVSKKKVGQYTAATQKVKYNNNIDLIVVTLAKNNKALKGNKYQSKIYYKFKGKSYSTKWSTGQSSKANKQNYQLYIASNKIKVKKLTVKYNAKSIKKTVKKHKSSSNTKTIKINKKMKEVKLKNGDSILVTYETQYRRQYSRGVTVEAENLKNGLDEAKHTKLTKVKVWYKNKGKVKTRSSTKIRNDFVTLKLMNGYTPYKVKVWYKNK